jgi:hypothetical protein
MGWEVDKTGSENVSVDHIIPNFVEICSEF